MTPIEFNKNKLDHVTYIPDIEMICFAFQQYSHFFEHLEGNAFIHHHSNNTKTGKEMPLLKSPEIIFVEPELGPQMANIIYLNSLDFDDPNIWLV